MRAALIATVLAVAPVAWAGTPLALAERQVVFLDFDRAVSRIAVTDPDLLGLKPEGRRLRVAAKKGGRASLEVAFEDGSTVVYDVAVEARRPAAPNTSAPGELALQLGEERRVPTHGAKRVLLEDNGIARVRVEGESVTVIGVSPGSTSLVVVDRAGVRTTWTILVR